MHFDSSARASDLPSDRPIRVAIVEDNKEIREGLSWLFRNTQGFSLVHSSENGEDALRTLPALLPDVVLMDIGLPGVSGIECIPKLKARCPNVQVSMLTVFEDDEAVFKSLRAGATGYLLKKTPPSGVLDSVRELHAGGSPMSSQIARRVLRALLALEPHVQNEKARSDLANLSPREQQILDLLAQGYRYKEIADRLNVTIHTIRTFVRRLYEKLHVHSRIEALNKIRGE